MTASPPPVPPEQEASNGITPETLAEIVARDLCCDPEASPFSSVRELMRDRHLLLAHASALARQLADAGADLEWTCSYYEKAASTPGTDWAAAAYEMVSMVRKALNRGRP